jgi:hypothetical protein
VRSREERALVGEVARSRPLAAARAWSRGVWIERSFALEVPP